MYFNYICYKCGTQHSQEIHPENITEFYCPTCDEHIGCSNTDVIKIIEYKKLIYHSISVFPEKIQIIKPEKDFHFCGNASTTNYYNTSGTAPEWITSNAITRW